MFCSRQTIFLKNSRPPWISNRPPLTSLVTSVGKHMTLTLTFCELVDLALVGLLVSGAPTFVIWHHSLIYSRDLAL